MAAERKPRRHFRMIVAGVVGLLLLPVYVLSYAPAVRFGLDQEFVVYSSPDITCSEASGSIAAYKPVEWLIDETPLREPLFWWADVCGVGGDVRIFAFVRSWEYPNWRIPTEPLAH